MTNENVMVDLPGETPRGSWWRRRRGVLLAGGLVFVGLAAFVMVWFQPQKLFIDDRVDEDLPGLVIPPAAAEPMDDGAADEEPMDDGAVAEEPMAEEPMDDGAMGDEAMEPMDEEAMDEEAMDDMEPAAPQSLADFQELAISEGAPQVVTLSEFVRLDKGTEGIALLVAMPDGSLLIRFEGFRTGNGPDVFIELSRGGPTDGNYSDMLRLGRMKGNVGDQNYEIPAETDLGQFQSVVIWCERFRSAFGAAPLVLPM